MYKYINFNNLRKKKWFTGKGVGLGKTHLYGNTKNNQKNTKRRKKEHEKYSTLWIMKKQWQYLFIVPKNKVFDNTENTKNKNTPLHRTNFLWFLFSRTNNSSWKQKSGSNLCLCHPNTVLIWSVFICTEKSRFFFFFKLFLIFFFTKI